MGGAVVGGATDAGRLRDDVAGEGADRRWRPSARTVIIGVLLLEALLSGAWAIWPPADTNRAHDAALAVVLVAMALGCALLWRSRGPLILVEAMLVVTWIVPMIVIVTRRLVVSEVLWAAIVILVAAVTVLYLPARPAAVEVTALTVAYVIASAVVEPRTGPLITGAVVLCIVVVSSGVAWMRRERDALVRRISELAVTDPLTGLLNRRGLESQAAVVHANAMRSGQDTVVALIDLDGLKRVNDTYGHEAGDAFITGVAEHWRSNLREGDLLARIGGDEFVIVLPNATADSAAELLTRIRSTAAEEWSHGWTAWNDGEGLEVAIDRADALMYAE